MKSPRRILTVRAMAAVTALFAVDFAGIAWVVRHEPNGNRAGVWMRGNPLTELIAPVVFFGPFLVLFVLIYRYVPPKLDEVFAVILILILLLALVVPALQHS